MLSKTSQLTSEDRHLVFQTLRYILAWFWTQAAQKWGPSLYARIQKVILEWPKDKRPPSFAKPVMTASSKDISSFLSFEWIYKILRTFSVCFSTDGNEVIVEMKMDIFIARVSLTHLGVVERTWISARQGDFLRVNVYLQTFNVYCSKRHLQELHFGVV